MRTVKSSVVLLYYDYAQVFIACDALGGQFICMLIEESEAGPRYIATPISPQVAYLVSTAKIDLRSIFARPEVNEFFYVDPVEHAEKKFVLSMAEYATLPERMLPEEGLTFEVHDEVALAASELNTTVSYVSLDVPEAEHTARIKADTLSEFLGLYQSTMKYLCRKAYADTGKRLKRDDASYFTDVYGFAKGSFTVKFRSSYATDIFGNNPGQSAALTMLQEFLAITADPDAAMRYLQEIRGHAAGAMIRLLVFLAENSCPIRLEWANPTMNVSQRSTTSLNSIKALALRVRERQDLAIEKIIIIGVVTGADTVTNTFSIVSDDDQTHYTGHVHPDSSVSLKGTILVDRRYEFHCEETVEMISATRREVRHLRLRNMILIEED